MKNNLQDLLQQLDAYSQKYSEEVELGVKFKNLIKTEPNCLLRDTLPGHLTASAWVIDQHTYCSFLLVKHAKLNLWVQPGGHADGNENLRAVACQELYEETGIVPLQQQEGIFDLSIHSIPASKNMPEHLHFDVRYLFLADASMPLRLSAESLDLGWFNLQQMSDMGCDDSVLKMARRSLEKF
jgi:8-oxo-dGTP pyrophosphatase MutT (NUDIX family)